MIDLFVDYNSRIGMGHLMRSRALASFIELDLDKTYKLPKNNIYNIVKSKNKKNKFSNNICIVDSFAATDAEVHALLESYSKVLLVDDWVSRRIDHERLAIIDWTISADKIKNNQYRKLINKTTFFVGEQFIPIKLKCDEIVKSNKKECLVYLGSDINYYSDDLIRLLLTDFGFEQITLVGRPINSLGSSSKIKICSSLSHDQFTKKLRRTSLFICSGGWSMYEALCRGISVGVIIRPGNCILDATNAIAGGYGIYIGSLYDNNISLAPSVRKMGYDQISGKYHVLPRKLSYMNRKLAKNRILEWVHE